MPVIDGYMAFQYYKERAPAGRQYLESESQVLWQDSSVLGMDSSFIALGSAGTQKGLFEIEDYNFSMERTLSTSSQSTGIGTGTATFEPFSVTRKIDRASPLLFEMSCSGTTFQRVTLALRKGTGDGKSGQTFLRFDFKMVGVKSMTWSHGDEAPTEEIAFEYGAVAMRYSPQKPNGELMPAIPGGWNRIKNVKDVSPDDIVAK